MSGLSSNRRFSYDSASDYGWADLNETEFLSTFFSHLEEQMGAQFEDFEFHVLSGDTHDLRPKSAASDHPRKVLFYISDETMLPPAEPLDDDYIAVFKSYLTQPDPARNLYSFNIGYVKGVLVSPPKPVNERPISVFFSGNLSAHRAPLYAAFHPLLKFLPPEFVRLSPVSKIIRTQAKWAKTDYQSVLPESFINFTDGFKQGLSLEKYGEMLGQSKIVFCPMGMKSPETFRHMESLRAGAIVISEKLPETRFYQNSPIIQVDSWRQGIAVAQDLLADEARLQTHQDRSMAWWETVMSEAATARYVTDTLRSLRQN